MRLFLKLYISFCIACGTLTMPLHAIAQNPDSDFAKDLSAAKSGHTGAYLIVGLDYYHGSNGAPQDYAMALIWLRKAADLGDPTAAQILGVVYARGNGVPQDSAMAAKWFHVAADRGIPGAAESAARWENMTAEGLTQERKQGAFEAAMEIIFPSIAAERRYNDDDRKKAFAVVEALANDGLAEAQYRLADFYGTSMSVIVGLKQDQAKASQLYLAAAEQSYPDAMLEIALRYEHGTGIAQDKALAMAWYRKVIKLPDNLYSHLTYTAGCKIDYLEDGKLDNRNCEDWTMTR